MPGKRSQYDEARPQGWISRSASRVFGFWSIEDHLRLQVSDRPPSATWTGKGLIILIICVAVMLWALPTWAQEVNLDDPGLARPSWGSVRYAMTYWAA